ncbi:PLD nuclease N-terminal domain-containing protein [Brevibacterium salitolerans]|uniref:PLD nuclease N-terminal domain-containing protein n=1 Tax=Brevibacterium salitolerans TaxID=1403566 RepID=UPI0031E23CAE
MTRGLIVGIVIVVAVMLYSVFDCALRPRDQIAALPKWAWILAILLFPVIGAVLWFVIGRRLPGGSGRRPQAQGPLAPDDDPDFLKRIAEDVEQQQRRERRERGEFD